MAGRDQGVVFDKMSAERIAAAVRQVEAMSPHRPDRGRTGEANDWLPTSCAMVRNDTGEDQDGFAVVTIAGFVEDGHYENAPESFRELGMGLRGEIPDGDKLRKPAIYQYAVKADEFGLAVIQGITVVKIRFFTGEPYPLAGTYLIHWWHRYADIYPGSTEYLWSADCGRAEIMVPRDMSDRNDPVIWGAVCLA